MVAGILRVEEWSWVFLAELTDPATLGMSSCGLLRHVTKHLLQ